jgi:hypothetical protein
LRRIACRERPIDPETLPTFSMGLDDQITRRTAGRRGIVLPNRLRCQHNHADVPGVWLRE